MAVIGRTSDNDLTDTVTARVPDIAVIDMVAERIFDITVSNADWLADSRCITTYICASLPDSTADIFTG